MSGNKERGELELVAGEKRLAYPYLRFSKPSQEEGDSVRRQTDWFAEVCEREGWMIDTSFPLEDRGKSAFHGKHLKAALGRFLQAVASGRIPKGSVLLFEYWDRCSRQERKIALPLVISILTAGIDIRTREKHYTEASIEDLGEFLDMTIKLGAAHEESRKKSERIKENWDSWRRRAEAGEKIPPPGAMPPWVDWDDGTGKPLGVKYAARKEQGIQFKGFVLIPSRVAAVRLIFQLAGDGLGVHRILARLNGQAKGPDGEPLPAIPSVGPRPRKSRGRREPGEWSFSHVAKLLSTRLALGEVSGLKVYPAAVTEHEYYLARSALEGRQIGNPGVGRASRGVGNLFPGMVFDGLTGKPMYLEDKGGASGSGRLLQAKGGGRTFPYPSFERGLLDSLWEVDPREVLGGGTGPDEVMVLSGKLRAVEDSIEALEADLDENGDSPTLFKRLRAREAEHKELMAQFQAARARAAHPLSEAWGDARGLLETLAGAPDPEDARLRLRTALRRVVDAIWVVIADRERGTKLAQVQIHFKGGARRDYLLMHRSHFGSGTHRRPPLLYASSIRDWEPEEVDLSDPSVAEFIAGSLEKHPDWSIADMLKHAIIL